MFTQKYAQLNQERGWGYCLLFKGKVCSVFLETVEEKFLAEVFELNDASQSISQAKNLDFIPVYEVNI